MRDDTNNGASEEVELQIPHETAADESTPHEPADDEPADDEPAVCDSVSQRLQADMQNFIAEKVWSLESALRLQLRAMSDTIASNQQELLLQMMELMQHHTHGNSNNCCKHKSPCSTGNVFSGGAVSSCTGSHGVGSVGIGGSVNHTLSYQSNRSSSNNFSSKSKAAKALDKLHTDELIRWDAYFESKGCHSETRKADDATLELSADASPDSPKDAGMLTERSGNSGAGSIGIGSSVNHTSQTTNSPSKSKGAKSLRALHTDQLIRWDAYFESERYNPELPEVDDGTKVNEAKLSADRSLDGSKCTGELDEGTWAKAASGWTLVGSRVLPGGAHEQSQQQTASRSNFLPGMESLRKQREQRIVKDMSSSVEAERYKATPGKVNMSLLRIQIRFWALWGILPLNSGSVAAWYRRCVMIFLGCASVLSISLLVQQSNNAYENIAQTSVSVCTLLCLACFTGVSNLVGPSERALIDHATSHGYLREWGLGGLVQLALSFSMWLFTVAISIMRLQSTSGEVAFTTILVWTVRNGVLFAFIHCVWQILSCLELMVDSYCVEFFDNKNCERNVAMWNSLQALLRRAGEAVENSILALQIAITTAFACGALSALELTLRWRKNLAAEELSRSILFQGEVLLLVLSSIIIFAKGASVTEKCVRVPPLVNSVLIEPSKHIDEQRSYLVTFIANSHAGFYVKGTRFTFSMLARLCYLFGTVTCGLGSAVLSTTQVR